MAQVLSSAQIAIVEYPIAAEHLLVTAAPGSGKTRVISERIGFLLETGQVLPEQVVAMTFTDEAAKNLERRLEQRLGYRMQGLQVGTIHVICQKVLKRFAAAAGLPNYWQIYDEQLQQFLLTDLINDLGMGTLDKIGNIRQDISQYKSRSLFTQVRQRQSKLDDLQFARIYDAYNQALRDEQALDFDDLIVKACTVLMEDAQAAEELREQVRFVFVDEFHDLSPDQMWFLKLLAPPQMPGRQVMVVADPNQAIYGWRDAEAQSLLTQYVTKYRARCLVLHENYRSRSTIVHAAQNLMQVRQIPCDMLPTRPAGEPLRVVQCQHEQDEAQWVARQIRALLQQGVAPNEIAVLCRTHKRANRLEDTLLKQQIPVQRTQSERLFERSDVRASLQYLALMHSFEDSFFEAALYWPKLLLDEVTMADLRRLAAHEGLSLSALFQQIDRYADRVSPLTRTMINKHVAEFQDQLRQISQLPIQDLVPTLLSTLQQHRNPISPSYREPLKQIMSGLNSALRGAVEHLVQALSSQRPIVISYTESLDSLAGALILHYALSYYLQQQVNIQSYGSQLPRDAFEICCGKARVANEYGLGLDIYQTQYKTVSYSISTQAWRLGQLLLMRYEHLRYGRYMLFDLETTGDNCNTTEVLELAALEYQQGRERTHYHQLSKPQGRISPLAVKVHGIDHDAVRHEPPIEQVMPSYVQFLGEHTLVGHNVESFDYPIIERLCQQLGLAKPSGPIIDTYLLAKRLLPNQSHRLEKLAKKFGYRQEQTHRALDDVRMNAFVFEHLLNLLDEERTLDCMSEMLPLVALGIASSGLPMHDYNNWLCQAGARTHLLGHGTQFTEHLLNQIADRRYAEDLRSWLQSIPIIDEREDRRWHELELLWQEILERYCENFDDHSLRGFLHYIELSSGLRAEQRDQPRVALSTIHAAKGKEWPHVFVIGCEEGTLPFSNVKDEEQLAEERRVLYVAITRAKEQVCCTWSQKTTFFQRQRNTTISRFAADLPADHQASF